MSEKLDAAIVRLAATVECGALLASTDPAAFIVAVADALTAERARAETLEALLRRVPRSHGHACAIYLGENDCDCWMAEARRLLGEGT